MCLTLIALINILHYYAIGDNAWKPNTLKSRLQPYFRQAFSYNLNYSQNGKFRYRERILDVESRPVGTAFEDSSYAYKHKNALFITIDVFYQKSPREQIGDAGTVTGQVQGRHLEWFGRILDAGRKHPDVRHIFVQGHLPVLYPVRKSKSSGMYMDNLENSDFW